MAGCVTTRRACRGKPPCLPGFPGTAATRCSCLRRVAFQEPLWAVKVPQATGGQARGPAPTWGAGWRKAGCVTTRRACRGKPPCLPGFPGTAAPQCGNLRRVAFQELLWPVKVPQAIGGQARGPAPTWGADWRKAVCVTTRRACRGKPPCLPGFPGTAAPRCGCFQRVAFQEPLWAVKVP